MDERDGWMKGMDGGKGLMDERDGWMKGMDE